MQNLLATQVLDHISLNSNEFISELRCIVESILRKWGQGDPDSIHDIAQDCFIKITESLKAGKFKGESSFKTYIYAVARYTCVDHYKSCKASEHVDIEKITVADPAASGEEILISRDERRVACRVLLNLPRECRKLWRAIYYGRRNYKQAADLLGLKEGTVKRKMWECRQLARKMAEDYTK
jgi:RNA polymerase sigma-70 factor (ECF subfamily)